MGWALEERRRKEREARAVKRFLALERLPSTFGEGRYRPLPHDPVRRNKARRLGDDPWLESLEALRQEAAIRRKYR